MTTMRRARSSFPLTKRPPTHVALLPLLALFLVYCKSAISPVIVDIGSSIHRAISSPSEDQKELLPIGQPGEIWIINQPKCGTDSIQESLRHFFRCGGTIHHSPSLRKIFCQQGLKMFRTHNYEEGVTLKRAQNDKQIHGKEHSEAEAESHGNREEPARCIAITAVRNPLQSIPSYFFQSRSHLCMGTQAEQKLFEEYEDYLSNDPRAPAQVETSVSMLRAFGATDIRSAMELLDEKGYAVLNQSDLSSPWAGCQLLFIQIDYDEDNSNINEAFGSLRQGLTITRENQRVQKCPHAAHNYEAVLKYGISDLQIDAMTATNPEIRDVIDYYLEHRRRDQTATE